MYTKVPVRDIWKITNGLTLFPKNECYTLSLIIKEIITDSINNIFWLWHGTVTWSIHQMLLMIQCWYISKNFNKTNNETSRIYISKNSIYKQLLWNFHKIKVCCGVFQKLQGSIFVNALKTQFLLFQKNF